MTEVIIIIIIIIISANVKIQNMFDRRNNIASSTNYKYRTAATLYTLETWGFQVNNCTRKYRA
jgi:hypothetical protein